MPVIADYQEVALKHSGVLVFPIAYPAVATGVTRLRFLLSVHHSITDLVATAEPVNETIWPTGAARVGHDRLDITSGDSAENGGPPCTIASSSARTVPSQ